MTYIHGVTTQEQATPLFSMRAVDSALPLVVGTAPIYQISGEAANTLHLFYSMAEFKAALGWSDDFEKFTLCEFAKVYFDYYRCNPLVVVNVLDPDTHKTDVASEEQTFASDIITLDHPHVLTGEAVKDATETTTYVKDTDYTINYITGVITRISTGSIGATEAVKVTYSYADPSKVTDSDIIGGVDGNGVRTGLEMIEDVFPRYRLVVGNVAAPGFSDSAAVAIVMAAKADGFNGIFRAQAVIDLPQTLTLYTDAPGHCNDNNLTDELMIVCYGKVTLGTETHWLSSHVCGLMASVDADHGGVPYKSPSNETLLIDGAVIGSDELWLDQEQAAYLNGNGIVTPLNFVGGWKLWGNRTAAYPAVTDIKDAFIPVRRMFNWAEAKTILTIWQKVDGPLLPRNVEAITETLNTWLAGLTAREMILGGRVEFLESENPVTDLMDGISRWHMYLGFAPPMRQLDFTLQYDPDYLSALFGG